MPTINFGTGAEGPLASLEVGAKYDTTYFPSDLSEAPYFIVFRAQNKYKISELGTVKTKFPGIGDYFASSVGDLAALAEKALTSLGSEGSEVQQAANRIAIEQGTSSMAANAARAAGTTSNARGLLATGISAVGGFAKALDKLGIEISQPAHSFALPIPSNLQTQYNAQYNTDEAIGALGQLGRGLGANFQPSQGLISDLTSAITQSNALSGDNFKGVLANLGVAALGSDVGTSALVAGALGGIGAAGAGAALGSLGTGILRGAGIARNPHIANIFTGVNFRKHNFTYKLVAKNKQESDSIRDLIRNFKYHMAPDYRASDHIFTYPSQFQIIIRAGDYLFKIADSVLTTFDVNYTGEGSAYFFEDTNAPVSVTINMAFTEDTIVTKKEVRAGR